MITETITARSKAELEKKTEEYLRTYAPQGYGTTIVKHKVVKDLRRVGLGSAESVEDYLFVWDSEQTRYVYKRKFMRSRSCD